MFDLNDVRGYYIHLVASAVNGTNPAEKPDSVDWQDVFALADRHNTENVVWYSLEKLNNKPDDAVLALFYDAYAKALNKCATQDLELELLVSSFASRGYDVLPLKGSQIRSFYPQPDMRTMTDIDLLVRTSDRAPVRDLMRSLGYTVDLLDDGQVDAFKKEPILYVEIHYDFSAETHAYHEFFTIDWSHLVATETSHLYSQTVEDLYYFNLGHHAKNMHNSGIGVRAVMDTYLLSRALGNDRSDDLNKRISDAGLATFDSKLLAIADIWFGGKSDDGSLDDLQYYIVDSSTYGSYKNSITLAAMYNDGSSSNLRYLLRKIFPSADYLYRRFGVKHRCFLLLPFLWIARICSQLFGKKEKWDNAHKQYSTFSSVSPDDIDYARDIRHQFGLL